MTNFYGEDLAYIQAEGFGQLAQGSAPEIVRRLKNAAVPILRVADLGCGAGVLSAALLKAGCEVIGIDLSAELLAVACAAAPQARFSQASIYDAELPACQALIALGEPLSYHQDAEADARIDTFFRRAQRSLPSGGLLIFDVIETGAPSLAGRTWASGRDWAVMVETNEDLSARRLERQIVTFRQIDSLYRRGSETHRVRLFDSSELTRQLERHGFDVEPSQAYGEYRLAPRRRAFFCTRL